MMHLAVAALLALAQNDKTQANSYDDAWEANWKAHCRTVLSGATGKTPGFVLQIGDSISHSMAYGSWIRGGANRTSEDLAIAGWCLATTSFSGGHGDTNNKNGFYLSGDDTSGNRGMTASGGIDSGNYVTGMGNGGADMPADTTQSSAASKVADGGTYPNNLHITTVANAFPDAQFAVVMLGTNDVRHGRTTGQLTTDLTAIINVLEGKKIAVILSTIPPQISADVTPFNTAIRSLAQSRSLPLIDYYAEILARQSGTAWQGTIISPLPDGVHPTGGNAGGDPYNGPTGNAGTHKTGSNAANDGYLLRTWLTTQKLKEVKYYVIDNGSLPTDADGDGLPDAWEVTHFGNTTSQNGTGNPDGDAFTNAQEFAAGTDPMNAASPAPTPTPTPTPTPSPSGGSRGGGGKCGGAIDGPASPAALVIAAMAAMALLAASRKSGF